MRAVLVPNSDIPPFESAIPDAIIERLTDLRPLIEKWVAPAVCVSDLVRSMQVHLPV